jgi:membrane protein implicated in regulation of membrane protease activity
VKDAARLRPLFVHTTIGHRATMGNPRLMMVIAGAAGLVVAAIALLAFGTWWALAIALGAHALGTLIVVGYALGRVNQSGDEPDSVEEARIERERLDLRERRRKTGQVNPAKDYEVF